LHLVGILFPHVRTSLNCQTFTLW